MGYDGDALADFVEIISRIDDYQVELEVKRSAAEAKRAAQMSAQKR